MAREDAIFELQGVRRRSRRGVVRRHPLASATRCGSIRGALQRASRPTSCTGADASVLRKPRDAQAEAEVRNYLVLGARELPINFNPENSYRDGNGYGTGSKNIEAFGGNGTGNGHPSDETRAGGGIKYGSIFAKRGNGTSGTEDLAPHFAIGLLHSDGLDDIREFTSFILLQPLIRRA